MTETILAICILFKNFYLKLSLHDLLDDQKFSGSMSIHVRVYISMKHQIGHMRA